MIAARLHAGAGHRPELSLFVILVPAHAHGFIGARSVEDAELERARDDRFFPLAESG